MYERYLNEAERHRDEVFALCDAIFDLSETAYREFRSAKALSDALEKNGFTVERGLAGIPTCFVATYGSGSPVIGIQAEFDALDVSWNCPTVQFHIGSWVTGTPGHSWQAVSQGKCRYAKEMSLFAGKAVAGTVLRLFERPDTLAVIKKEHTERTKGGYICPIPPEIMPGV